VNYYIDWKWCDLPISESEIKLVEFELKVRFEDDFVNLVMNYNGGYPSKKYFDYEKDKQLVFNNLLSLKKNGSDPTLLETYFSVCDRLPYKIIPFGITPFGDLICLSFKEMPNSICIWNHEIASINKEKCLSKIATDLNVFLKKLY
jgi:hypothetical protein